MTFDWNRDTNSVIKKYFAQPKILVQHQLESYNNTVETVIPSIINHQNPIQIPGKWNSTTKKFELMYEIRFKDVYMCRPLIRDEHETIKPLYPQEARLRNLTYSAPIFVDLEQKLLNITDPETPAVISEGIEKKVPLCNFPVMLQSNYCHLAEAEPQDLPGPLWQRPACRTGVRCGDAAHLPAELASGGGHHPQPPTELATGGAPRCPRCRRAGVGARQHPQ